ncbi:MAG: hypothetical protein J2P40_05075 [Candidatus Dormibacteraeota bacterium]|nr:hypothetical protein [Candidatus Dormibacteraeota bacterium]MBO0706539.1 hypothetical protein [Candidatus Dormibacteraeota bacterium]MBO0760629.1 hypothetical protein [Candidatus Dormibacteraeota bacterium]
MEHCYAQGWTDGLPVVPASPSAVGEFVDAAGREPDEVIGTMPHLGRACTVELAAINAVMAGCLPEHFPVVLAAWEALKQDGMAFGGLWQSTTGSSPFFIVNGPARPELGFNSGGNVFGPGCRANATVARAIRLIAINAFDLRPHVFDQSTQGTPAKYTCCIAENEEESPWEPLHVERGFSPGTSTVAAMMIRSTAHIDNRHATRPEELLSDLLGTIVRTGNLMHEASLCVAVLGPEHARFLARRGFSKTDVKEWLVDHATLSLADFDRVGKGALDSHTRWRVPRDHGPETLVPDPGALADPERIRVLASPEAVAVVVAGAGNAGVSTIVEPVGRSFGGGVGAFPALAAI